MMNVGSSWGLGKAPCQNTPRHRMGVHPATKTNSMDGNTDGLQHIDPSSPSATSPCQDPFPRTFVRTPLSWFLLYLLLEHERSGTTVGLAQGRVLQTETCPVNSCYRPINTTTNFWAPHAPSVCPCLPSLSSDSASSFCRCSTRSGACGLLEPTWEISPDFLILSVAALGLLFSVAGSAN